MDDQDKTRPPGEDTFALRAGNYSVLETTRRKTTQGVTKMREDARARSSTPAPGQDTLGGEYKATIKGVPEHADSRHLQNHLRHSLTTIAKAEAFMQIADAKFRCDMASVKRSRSGGYSVKVVLGNEQVRDYLVAKLLERNGSLVNYLWQEENYILWSTDKVGGSLDEYQEILEVSRIAAPDNTVVDGTVDPGPDRFADSRSSLNITAVLKNKAEHIAQIHNTEAPVGTTHPKNRLSSAVASTNEDLNLIRPDISHSVRFQDEEDQNAGDVEDSFISDYSTIPDDVSDMAETTMVGGDKGEEIFKLVRRRAEGLERRQVKIDAGEKLTEKEQSEDPYDMFDKVDEKKVWNYEAEEVILKKELEDDFELTEAAIELVLGHIVSLGVELTGDVDGVKKSDHWAIVRGDLKGRGRILKKNAWQKMIVLAQETPLTDVERKELLEADAFANSLKHDLKLIEMEVKRDKAILKNTRRKIERDLQSMRIKRSDAKNKQIEKDAKLAKEIAREQAKQIEKVVTPDSTGSKVKPEVKVPADFKSDQDNIARKVEATFLNLRSFSTGLPNRAAIDSESRVSKLRKYKNVIERFVQQVRSLQIDCFKLAERSYLVNEVNSLCADYEVVLSVIDDKIEDQEVISPATPIVAGASSNTSVQSVSSTNPTAATRWLRDRVTKTAEHVIKLMDENMPKADLSEQKIAQIRGTVKGLIEKDRAILTRHYSAYLDKSGEYIEWVNELPSDVDADADVTAHYKAGEAFENAESAWERWSDAFLLVSDQMESDFKCSNEMMSKLKTPEFSGTSGTEHIYSFLKKFRIRFESRATTKSLAELLFECLSKDVQRRMIDSAHDYKILTNKLVEEYGDPLKIAEAEKIIIAKIRLPKVEADSIIAYLETLCGRLSVIKKVVEDFVNAKEAGTVTTYFSSEDLQGTIYSLDFLNWVRGTLPPGLQEKVVKKIVNWKTEKKHTTYKEEFNKMASLLGMFLEQQKNYVIEGTATTVGAARSGKSAPAHAIMTIFGSGSTGSVDLHGDNGRLEKYLSTICATIDLTKTGTPGARKDDKTKPIGGADQPKLIDLEVGGRKIYNASHVPEEPVCSLDHTANKSKFFQNPHYWGQCTIFMTAKPDVREEMIKIAKVCFCCMAKRCGQSRVGKPKCGNKDQVIYCKECRDGGIKYENKPKNILICKKHKSSFDLTEFLATFADSFSGKGFDPSRIQNKVIQDSMLTMFSPKDEPSTKVSLPKPKESSVPIVSEDSVKVSDTASIQDIQKVVKDVDETTKNTVTECSSQNLNGDPRLNRAPSLLSSTEKKEIIIAARKVPNIIVHDTEKGVVHRLESEEALKKMVEDSVEDVLFIFQIHCVAGIEFLTFFDGGANNHAVMMSKARACGFQCLDSRVGYISGVGDTKVEITGIWRAIFGFDVRGQTHEIIASGLRSITSEFCSYDLTVLHEEVREYDNLHGNHIKDAPLPIKIGGHEVSLLIGLKATRMQPLLLHSLPSGLMVFQMTLKDITGSRFAFGGPHKLFSAQNRTRYGFHLEEERALNLATMESMYTEEYISFRDGIKEYGKYFSDYSEEADIELIEILDEGDVFEDSLVSNVVHTMFTKACADSGTFPGYEYPQVDEDLIRKIDDLAVTIKSVENTENLKNCTIISTFSDNEINSAFIDEFYPNVTFAEPISKTSSSTDDSSMDFSSGSSDEESEHKTPFETDSDSEEESPLAKLLSRPQRKVSARSPGVSQEYRRSLARAADGTATETALLSTCYSCGNHLYGCPAACDDQGLLCDSCSVGPGLLMDYSQNTSLVGGGIFSHGCLSHPRTCAGCPHINAHITTRKLLQQIKDEEESGSVLDYRCPKCSDCSDCKSSDRTRARSMTEESEQRVIDASVRLDWDTKETWCELPFTKDPATLVTSLWEGQSSNIKMARRVLATQCKLDPVKRAHICNFMEEIRAKGFIKPVSELSQEWQDYIHSSPIHHFYPWRSVDNPGSISTPHRTVVDSSMSGLNSCLPKGENNLCKLVEILINFRSWFHAYSYDISKMYNSLKMMLKSLPFQLFLWRSGLDFSSDEELWLFVVCIYGVISSGNQATSAIRQAATVKKVEFPLAHHAITKNTYVDDGLGGANTPEECLDIVQQVTDVLEMVGIKIKVVTMTGQKPTEKASKDGKIVGVGGYSWAPVEGHFGLGLDDLNFNKKQRGSKKPTPVPVVTVEDMESIWPNTWTKKVILGKAAEMWDILGLIEPLKVDWKLAFHELNIYSWDAALPPEIVEKFKTKIRDWFKIQALTWTRCVIPTDAVDPLSFRLIQCSDGATMMSAAGVYIGLRRKNGRFSCQLLMGKSRIASQTIPRNELDSCLLGTCVTEVVKRALGARCKEVIRVTDSVSSLCWISNPAKLLRIFVFHRVKEIRRFSDPKEWYHVSGVVNPVDKGTRPGMTVADVGPDSVWHSGHTWMQAANVEDMNLTRYKEIATSITDDSKDAMDKEEWVLPELQLHHLAVEINGKLHYITDDQDQIFNLRRISTESYELLSAVPDLNSSSFSGIKTEHLIVMGDSVDSLKVCLSAHYDPLTFSQCDVNTQDRFFHAAKPKVVEKPKSCGFINPVYWGWRSMLKITKICYYFIHKFIHKSHSKMNTDISSEVVASLRAKCSICSHAVKATELLFPLEKENDVISKVAGTVMVTRGEKKRQEEKSKGDKKMEKIFGVRKPSLTCLCERVQGCKCKKEGCMFWAQACANAESSLEIAQKANMYWIKIASAEVLAALTPSQLSKFVVADNVVYYDGRIEQFTDLEVRDISTDFLERNQLTHNMMTPVALAESQISYSLVNFLHWEVLPHSGVESTMFQALKFMHIIGARKLITRVRVDCRRCRALKLRTVSVEMGRVSPFQLQLAPAFYSVQADLVGPFLCSMGAKSRSTGKVWGLILVCISTGATSALIMEDYSTEAFILALYRQASRYGMPAALLPDMGSQLVKGSTEARFTFVDLQQAVHTDKNFSVRISAVQAHSERGLVERKIRSVRELLQKLGVTHRLTPLQWETALCRVSSMLNNLPIAYRERGQGGRSNEQRNVDVITPNQLILGRNWNRELLGDIKLPTKVTQILENNSKVQKDFYKLLMSYVHRLLPRQKRKGSWKTNADRLQVGDIVLVKKLEGSFSELWQIGRVTKIVSDRYRKVMIEYVNASQNCKRETERRERDLVLLSSVDDLDLNTMEYQETIAADMRWAKMK